MTGWPQLSSGPPSSLALKAAFIDFRSLKTCTVNMSSLSELCVGETVLRLWTLHITVTSTPLGVDEVEMDEWISVYENHMVSCSVQPSSSYSHQVAVTSCHSFTT